MYVVWLWSTVTTKVSIIVESATKLLISPNITHYQMTNFRLFQTESICRQQFHIRLKWEKAIQTGRKHCGKRRNCSLRAISPCPTVFSKGLFPRASKGTIVWEWVKACAVENLVRLKSLIWQQIMWKKEKVAVKSMFQLASSLWSFNNGAVAKVHVILKVGLDHWGPSSDAVLVVWEM